MESRTLLSLRLLGDDGGKEREEKVGFDNKPS
jgi:hypothetical protein